MSTENTGFDFLSDIDENDIVIEERAFGSLYPIVQWQNGSPSMAMLDNAIGNINYTGGFFYDDQSSSIALQGFESVEKATLSGDSINGFGARTLQGQIIGYRRCWEVDAEDGSNLVQRYAYEDYELAKDNGKPRQRVNILFLPTGAEDAIVITMRGMVAAKFMSGVRGKEGPYSQVGTKLCNNATQLRRRKNNGRRVAPTPLAFFTVTLGSKTEMSDGKKPTEIPVFVEVGSEKKNKITPIFWTDEPDDDALKTENLRNTINSYFAGKDRYDLAQRLWQEAQEWMEAWDAENINVRRGRRGARTDTDIDTGTTSNLPATDEMTL